MIVRFASAVSLSLVVAAVAGGCALLPDRTCSDTAMYGTGCDSDEVCNGKTHTCLVRGGEGGPCQNKADCREGFVCHASSTCGAPLKDGQACRTDECGASSCLPAVTDANVPRDAPRICRPLSHEGGPCWWSSGMDWDGPAVYIGCVKGLVCIPLLPTGLATDAEQRSDSAPGTCAPAKSGTVGEPCTSDDSCSGVLVCDTRATEETYQCLYQFACSSAADLPKCKAREDARGR